VEALGGTLDLESRPGEGTEAVISLPLAVFDAEKQVKCSPS